jgi:hypothetical protein
MRLLYVPLTEDEREQLIDLAIAERRRPQEFAGLLLSRALAELRPDAAEHDESGEAVTRAAS